MKCKIKTIYKCPNSEATNGWTKFDKQLKNVPPEEAEEILAAIEDMIKQERIQMRFTYNRFESGNTCSFCTDIMLADSINKVE